MCVPIKTIEFVEKSDLFEQCDSAWNFFIDNKTKGSFGNNNITLINASDIVWVLSKNFNFSPLFMKNHYGDEIQSQINKVVKRIEEIGKKLIDGDCDDFYVDLEN